MKYITLEMLKQTNACADKQYIFKVTFGLRAELTEANMAKAVEAGLNFDWLTLLLPQPALEAYTGRRAAMWKDYESQCAPLYKAQRMLLWKDYEEQRNTLLLNALIAA